jgi:orotidine-5'-phosphate decarboxylase
VLAVSPTWRRTLRPPVPIVALDVPTRAEAEALLERVGAGADLVKVGLQLFTSGGPDVVRALRDRGVGVFLDLKFHDIPTTVAGAVASAASLGVDLLTVHAAGGAAMLRAARAAADAAPLRPRLLAVTVLTSLSAGELGAAWGRGGLTIEDEAERLACLASESGMDGVVASVHEIAAVRRGGAALVLTPGIRLEGDAAGDQTRVATPSEAARAGADWVVLGRSVTAAADPAAALARVRRELAAGAEDPAAVPGLP